MDEQRLQRALRAGPPFTTSYAMRPLELTDSPLAGTPARLARTVMVLAMMALLVAAALAGLAIAGFLRSSPGIVAYSGVLPNGVSHVFVVTEDGVEHDLFSQSGGEFDARVLDWSLDRGQIAFLAYQESKNGIFVAGADGTTVREVLQIPGDRDVWGCGWAPGGGEIAICSEGGLTVVDVTSGQATEVAVWEAAADVQWAPDASWLLLRTERNVEVVRPDGSSRHSLGSDDEHVLQASWAPDGSHIVFTTASRGTAGTAWIVRPDGGELRELAATSGWWPTPVGYPFVWAPNSRGVAFQELSGPNTIDIVGLDGRATTIDLRLEETARLTSLLGWSNDVGIVAIAAGHLGQVAVTVSPYRDGSQPIGVVGDGNDEAIWLDGEGRHAIWQEDVSPTLGCIVRLDLVTTTTARRCVPVADLKQRAYQGNQYVWARPD